MRVLMLLLLLAASPHPPPAGASPLDYQASPDYELQPLNVQREGLRTNRQPEDDLEVGGEVPRLRTNVRTSERPDRERGVETNNNRETNQRVKTNINLRNRGVETNNNHETNRVKTNNNRATSAALQDPDRKRSRETARRSEQEAGSNPGDEESTWVWGTSDGEGNKTQVDDLDDRTTIAGENCPTGQVKVEGKCVTKHDD